jgi:HEAT repeat protein
MIENIKKLLHTSPEETDTEQEFQRMLQDVRSADTKTRRIAIHVLAEMQDPRAVPALREVLQGGDRLTQRDAIESLGMIGDPRAVPDLLEALHMRDWFIRQAAIEALGTIGDPQAIPTLVEALHSDDVWVATEAAEALGRIGHVDALPALLEMLRADTLRASFAASVENSKIPVDEPDMAVVGTFRHEISDLRCAIASALGRISDARAVPDLVAVLSSDPDTKLRATAAEALERIGTPQAVAAARTWRRQQHA